MRGKQRKQVDAALLIAAIIALGEQLQAERREQEQAAADGRQTPACRPPEAAS